jgi:hypothetical protein
MAKKQMAQAKVHYNEERDSFELWIRSSEKEEWGFCCSTQCQALEGENEANFIHFTFLKEVMNCIKLGYDVFEG